MYAICLPVMVVKREGEIEMAYKSSCRWKTEAIRETTFRVGLYREVVVGLIRKAGDRVSLVVCLFQVRAQELRNHQCIYARISWGHLALPSTRGA